MTPEILPPVAYVRAATFPTVQAARMAHLAIQSACMGLGASYDIGSVAAAWEGVTPCVVVTAMIEAPPLDAQAAVEHALSRGERWEPPQELVDAIIMRRVRQMQGEGATLPNGMRLFVRNNQFTQVDRFGRDVP